jgi:probable HAF family extracellular repeat protein
MNCVRLLASLVAITVLSFYCIEKAAARYDPYLSDPTTSFFGRLIIQNDELNTADGSEIANQQTLLLEAALQRFDIRGSRPTPTNRVSLQPSNLPTASGSGTNLSRDGSCAVGYQDAGFFTPFHALRWTQATGPLDLGTLDSANNASRSSTATDTNQDCSVVVGFSDVIGGVTEHAFRWTSAGMNDLGAPANGGPNSRAFGVSSNGTVVVGEADFPDPANLASGKSLQAFRWTQAGGFQNINDSPQPTLSLATAVTGDGTVVVGQVRTSNNASSAVRWTFPPPPAQLVIQSIGPLPGHATAAATGVSDNGKIVVGISNPDFLQYRGPVLGWNGGIAFRWGESGPNAGMKDLRELLVANGTDLTDITLVSVTGISPDGQWIQGKATRSQSPNETVAFVAQFCDENIVGGLAACSTSAPPFTLGTSAPNNSLTVSAGQSASTTIIVTPNAGFAQPVTFACSGLPQGATCNFSPATVTPPATASTTLTINTDGGPVALLSPRSSPTMFAYALTPLGLMLIGGLWYRRRVDDHGLWTGWLLVLMIALASCSSSDSSTPPANSGSGVPATGTPAGTSTVTVTASSGSSSSGVPVQLTVTR